MAKTSRNSRSYERAMKHVSGPLEAVSTNIDNEKYDLSPVVNLTHVSQYPNPNCTQQGWHSGALIAFAALFKYFVSLLFPSQRHFTACTKVCVFSFAPSGFVCVLSFGK